jgi:hypothetical protein
MNQKMKQVASTYNLNYKFTNYNIQATKRSDLHSLKEIKKIQRDQIYKEFRFSKRSKLKRLLL